MRVPLESDPVALAVYRWWTAASNWRKASAYPRPDTILQWFGIEFRVRHQEVRQRLREFLETLSPEQRSLLGAPQGSRISGRCPDTVGYFAVMFPDWPRPRLWPRFSSADEVARNPAGYVHLTFNLRDPIEPQLERARKILQQWQQGHVDSGAIPPLPDTREHRDLFPSYLRVLDAKEDGATHEEIANTLDAEQPDPGRINEDTVKNWLKVARRYRDCDYITLLPEVGATKEIEDSGMNPEDFFKQFQ
jgi:hypothetical protein